MYHTNITLVNLFSSNIVVLGIWWWTAIFSWKTNKNSRTISCRNRFKSVWRAGQQRQTTKRTDVKASLKRFTVSLRIQPSLLRLVAARDGCIPRLFYSVQTSDYNVSFKIFLSLHSCSAASTLSAFTFIWHQKTPTLASQMKTDFQLFSPGSKTLIKTEPQ